MLTPKQENFCLAYLETGNASEAYRRSYSAEKMKPNVINVKACQLLDNGNIRIRLDELRKPKMEEALCTFEQHLADLKMLRDLAINAGQLSAAISAEASRGKASGHYIERQEISGKDGGPIQSKWEIEIITKKGQ